MTRTALRVYRVNVNTTDATTGATALLLPVSPGFPRCLFTGVLCVPAPPVFLNRNSSASLNR